VTLPRLRVAAALALLAALAPRAVSACAGCRNPNLPITRLSNVDLLPGELRLSGALSATALNVVHQDGCNNVFNCYEVPAQPLYLHDQDIYPGELRAIAEYGLTTHWGVEAQLPFRVTATTIQYKTLDGQPYQPLDPGVHHRDETLAGIGDPWLMGRFSFNLLDAIVTARAGSTVPLGRTEPDPFLLGDMGIPHEHIQFGTGSFNPLLALDVSRTFGRVMLAAYGQAQLSVYENGEGFRAPNRFFAGLSGGAQLIEKVTTTLGLDVLNEGQERWHGFVRQDGNLGRTELLAGLTLTRQFGNTLYSLVARVPVYRHIVQGSVDPGNLTSPVSATFIVSHTFGSGG
jgi:hypothetical protein